MIVNDDVILKLPAPFARSNKMRKPLVFEYKKQLYDEL